MSTAQDKLRAKKTTESVAIDLRQILNDARAMVDEFETYVESWDQQVEAHREDDVTHDPREMTQEHVITRALEMIDGVEHVHSGSSRASQIRTAKRRLIQLAQAAPQPR